MSRELGVQTERVRLKVVPLAVSVRSPVSIALGVTSGFTVSSVLSAVSHEVVV